MNTYPYLSPWLQCLHKLAPPRGLVHVGAGGGSALQYPYAAMPRLLAIEADAQQLARVQNQLEGNAHCQLMQAVVSGQPGEADFYTLSLSNENSLCAPESLQTLWPNIKPLQSQKRATITLKELLLLAKGGPDAFNWAFIDCLPATDVLSSANTLPQAWDVVVVRALKDAPANASPAVQAMSLAALTAQLDAFGLEFLAADEENHPQVVRALFVRNPAKQLAQVQQQARAQYEQLTQEQSKLVASHAGLTGARDQLASQLAAESKAKAEALAQRDAEAKAKIETLAQRDAEASAKAQAIAQRDAEAKAKAEAIAQRDAEVKAKAEAIAQRDAEAKAKAEAIAHCDALAKEKAALAAAYDEQAKLAAERQTALTAHQAQLNDLQTRHEQLTQEQSKLVAAHAGLTGARDKLASQLAAESKAKAEALAQRDAEAAAKAQAITQRDAEAKAKAEAIAQRDAEAKAKAEAIAQRDALAKEKAALAAARDEQAKLAAERQTALATTQQESETKLQRYQRMEADNQEHAMRQQMMQEELIRAEAQIDLIKDLLLREPGF